MYLVSKRTTLFLLAIGVLAFSSRPAAAQGSIFDKLKNAAKNGQNKQHQQGQQQTGGPVSSGGATNLHGLDDYNRCMARTTGYHEELWAQALQHRLDSSATLGAGERQKIEQDIEYLTATSKGQRVSAPEPRNPQRYMLVITDDEQVAINTEVNRYSTAVHDFCEERYGGMSQFGDPAGRRPTHKLPEPQKQAPVVVASAPARRPTSDLAACMAQRNGLQYRLMADKIEAKMSTAKLTAAQRKEWEEDVAMLRTAAEGGTSKMPQSPDPKNPMRYFTHLNADEQMAVNQEVGTKGREITQSCMSAGNAAGGSAGGTSGGTTSDSSSSELEAMHARRRAERTNAPSSTAIAENARALAQAWLDAHPMQARKEVKPTHGLGTTEADYLEKSGTMACFERAKGFRAKLLAERLTTKRNSVAPQDRRELDGWIAAWHAAEQSRSDAAAPPPGSNPNRDLQFLTNADQQEINMANSIVSNKVRDECNAPNPFGGKQR
jgi:hypothetical protein